MIHSSVKRWGNSPAVRIPATLMQALNLNIDDEVKIDLACTTTKQVCVCVFLVQRNQKDIRSKLFYPVRNVMA